MYIVSYENVFKVIQIQIIDLYVGFIYKNIRYILMMLEHKYEVIIKVRVLWEFITFGKVSTDIQNVDECVNLLKLINIALALEQRRGEFCGESVKRNF